MMARTAWLLDANVVSEMMRPAPEPRVARFLDRIATEGIGLSAVTVREILNGIGRLDPGRRREDLTERLQGILDDLFKDRIDGEKAKACLALMPDFIRDAIGLYRKMSGAAWN
jgi:predicted nucleic acid-binding protein